MSDLAEFNTVGDKAPTALDKCKLLFANKPYTVLSVEIFCDEIDAGELYRVVYAEDVDLFDIRLLSRISFLDPNLPVAAAIVYGATPGGCRFVSSGKYSTAEYTAVAFDLYLRGIISRGESVAIISPRGVGYTDGGEVLFEE